MSYFTAVTKLNEKETLLMSRWFEIAAPAVGPYPGTTLTTPLGNPASRAREATNNALRGVCSAEKKNRIENETFYNTNKYMLRNSPIKALFDIIKCKYSKAKTKVL